MKNKQIFSESTPPRHKGLFARFRSLRFMLVMLLATLGVNVAFGADVTLATVDFSTWENQSICNSSNNTGETVNGVFFYSKNSSAKPFTISDGVMTWCNNNASTSNYYLAIPVSGVNEKLVIRVYSSGNTRAKYAIAEGTTPKAGSNGPGTNISNSASNPDEITISSLTKSDYVVYLGRQGSGFTTCTKIEILTAAPAGPVDPTATFSDANYEIGGTLDLASKFTSNSEGAVTYTVKDAGTTGATIAGSNFTATAAGTAIVTASQAAVADKYNAKSWDATITVTAPVAKYAVNFAAGEGTGTMTALEYAENAEVTLPACTFTAPDGKEFDAWTSSDVTITDGKFTMPANEVTVTATWKDLPVIDYLIKIEPTSRTAFTITGTIGGTGAVASLGGPDTDGGYKLNSEGAYMAVTLASGYFEPGDKVIAYCTTAQSKKFTVSTGTTEASVIGSTSGNWVKGENVYVLPETLGENVNTLYVARIGSGTYAQNPNILWIKVVRPAKHDVIFAAGDGTGSMETKQVAEGANYTIPNCTFTAPTGKEFDAWTSSDVTITDGKFTMPANNVTLTATWKTSVAKHTVTYKDGETELGTEEVAEGEKAASVPTPTKELNTFAGWEDAEHNAIDFATLEVHAAVTAYAKWTAFGEATSIDIEQFVIDNTKSSDIKAELTAHNFDYKLESDDVLDDLNDAKDYKNVAFRGLKMKHNGTFVVANIPAGKLVDVVIGNLGAAKVQINGADAATALVAGAGSGDKTVLENYKNSHNYYYSETAAVLKVLSTGTSTTVLKAINFLDPFVVTFANGGEIDPMTFKGTALTLPVATGEGEFQGWFDAETEGNPIGMAGDTYSPTGDITLYAQFSAQSSDNSLKTLKYGETSILEADKYTYDIVLPYKSVVPATVTYEANSAVATPAGEQTATVTDGTATFTITAENGDAAEYTVNFTVAKKDAIEILGTTVTGQKAHGEMTGLFSEGAEADLYVSSSYKLDKDRYVGLTLPEGKKFAAGDIVAIDVKTIQGCVGFTLFTDKGTTLIIDTRDGNAVSTGWNYVTLPEDYVGSQSIYLYRVNNSETNMNPEVNGMKVLRIMNPVLTALTVAGKTATINEANKTISVKLDNGTDAATAELVPTIVANGGEPTAALAATLAYNTPVNYVLTDKDGDQTTYVLTATEAAAPAATPDITVQPASHDYLDTEVIAALTVEATVSDAGVLSYQWYKGEELVGENLPTYTPTEAGSYKVVVTNTLGEETATATSDVAVINITHIYTFNDWTSGATFTKAGEWTIYPYNKDNKWLIEDVKFVANQTISAADASVKANVFNDQYFVLKFEEEVKNLVIANYNSGSDRYINGIYTVVLGNPAESRKGSTTEITSNYGITYTGRSTNAAKVSTTTINGHFEAGVYYVLKMNSSTNAIFDIFATESAKVSDFAGLTAGKIGDADMTAEQLAELNGTEHTLTLSEAVSVAPAVKFTYKETETYDDSYVKTLASEEDVVAESNRVGDNYEISKEIAGVTYKVVVPVDVTPALSLDITAGTAAIAGKTGRSKSFTVELTGANLANGEYTVNVPAVDGLTVTPAAFTVADNAVNTTFTITYASDADVAENVANIEFTVGATTATFALTYSSVAWTDYTQVDVDGTTTWNWANAGSNVDKGSESSGLLANEDGITNDETFKSQALNYVGRYPNRGGYFQGGKITFHTTVAGTVSVQFTNTGGNAARTIKINGKYDSETSSTGTSPKVTYSTFVQAGDVVIEGIQVSDLAAKDVRIFKITFTEAVYESVRDVTPGMIGTICLPTEVLAVRGATFYQIEKPTAIGVDFVEATEFPAGTPFIFEAEATAIEVVCGEGTATEGLTVNGLVGNLGERYVIPNDGHQNYIIYNNHLAYCVPGNTNYVGKNRAYIQLDAVVDMSEPEQVGQAPRRRISMGGAETEVTTGLEAIESVEAQKVLMDGVLYIIRAGKTYTPAGQLVK